MVFRVVGAVRLSEMIAGLKRNFVIARQKKQENESFERIELYFRDAKIFDQWWQAVCFATDKMGFTRSHLSLTNRDGTRRLLTWERQENNPDINEIINSTLSIRDRRAGESLNLEVRVNANGSLESAGRRLALFSRLLEQYGVANLPN
jgi:hypothetical protein